MDLQADASHRRQIYRSLETRNRVVGILRYGIPALGTVVLAGLILQIYVAGLGSRFGVGQITVSNEAINVEAPEYAGMLDDGSSYRVWSASATALIDQMDQINLAAVAMSLQRASGVTIEVNAQQAVLDTSRRVVIVDDAVRIEDSTGTNGTLHQATFNWADQILDSSGAVHIDYADGTTVDAEGIHYSGKKAVWTFTRATLTLPLDLGQDNEDPQ